MISRNKQDIIYGLLRKKTFLFLLVIVFHGKLMLLAQQQPLYSQFIFNKYLFNPAAAGSGQFPILTLSAYEQWIGFPGAPKYHAVCFDTRILQESRKPRRNIRLKQKLFKPGSVGTGIQLFNEKHGPLSQTGIAGTYSYYIQMGSRQFSMGISPVFSNFGLKASDVVLSDEQSDPVLEGDNTHRWIIDFNFGAYLTDNTNYYAGYSVHHLSRSALQWGGSVDTDFRIWQQHYLMGGYRYRYSEKLTFEPSLLLKVSENRKNQLDISLNCTILENYWCGLSYKTSKTISAFGGIQYNRYTFCYAFDYTLASIRKSNYGSHELILAVRLGQTIKRYRWLDTY